MLNLCVNFVYEYARIIETYGPSERNVLKNSKDQVEILKN